LIIDDQYATQAAARGNLCYQCGLVKITEETSDRELEELAASEDAVAGAVFSSGQVSSQGLVENSIEEVLKTLRAGWPSAEGWRWALILLDIRFDSEPKRDDNPVFGLKILEELVRTWPDRQAQTGNSELPIVMLSTISREERARQANQAGALAYVEKEELRRERLQELLDEHGLITDSSANLVGRSVALLRVLREARRVARMRSGNAMILGPQGSGKSSLALYIHEQSMKLWGPRPFVSFFSAPSAKALEYANLFGYWYGAHNTATVSAGGKAEDAHKGTLLIDEVHNLKSDTQQELLQFGRLENGRRFLTRLGNFPSATDKVNQAKRSVRGERDPATSRIAVDVLVLSATNEPLDDPNWRATNGFSEPLYTRLAIEYAGQPMLFPNMDHRREDIAPLFEFFLKQETAAIGGRTNSDGTKTLDAEVKNWLLEYEWPGNVAEMKGVALAVARNSRDFPDVFARHLPTLSPATVPRPSPPTEPLASQSNSVADAERALRNAQVPRSIAELGGGLASLHDAYGQLIKELLEVALEQTKLARGSDDFITPTLRLLFGPEIRMATQAYGKLLALKKLFKNHPPPPGSLLAYAIQKAEDSRNPKSRKIKKGESDT
jgi:two-component system response regulator FlrC